MIEECKGKKALSNYSDMSKGCFYNFDPVAKKIDAMRRLQAREISPCETEHYFCAYFQANSSKSKEMTAGLEWIIHAWRLILIALFSVLMRQHTAKMRLKGHVTPLSVLHWRRQNKVLTL